MATQINTNQIKDDAVTAAKLAPGPAQYAASTTAVTVVNSAVETSLWSFTLSADDIGTDGLLVVRASGSVDTLSSAQGFRFKLKLGSTDVVDIDATVRVDGGPAAFLVEFRLKADGAANAQDGRGLLLVRGPGVNTGGDPDEQGAVGTGAEDTTSDLTVDVRWSWDGAGASNTITFEEGEAMLYTP
jgi:hypothetical protein